MSNDKCGVCIGANVNHKDYFNDRTPLMNACAKAHPQVVEALIAAGENSHNLEPIHCLGLCST